MLPLIYLVVRSTDASGGIWAYMVRPQTLVVLARTLLLVVGVSLASLVVALPIAYLTTRTDLPGRRLWFVLTTLPLVIPSYVFAYTFVSAFASGGLPLIEPRDFIPHRRLLGSPGGAHPGDLSVRAAHPQGRNARHRPEL